MASAAARRGAAVLAVLVMAAATSCTTLKHALLGETDSEARAAQLNALQLKVMRYGDEYSGRIEEPIHRFQNAGASPEERLAAQQWRLSQSTAAYTIASGPNPVTNALDMIVLATLSRMVLEDRWIAELYGERARALHDRHANLERQAWTLVDGVLTAEQIGQLHHLIDQWRVANPRVRDVTHVHFDEFARSSGAHLERSRSAPSLIAFLGFDPLSNLDPAVREIAQTRQLAERSIYYLQRAPALLDMQVERIAYQFSVTPEVREMLTNADRVSLAAEAAGSLARQLPDLIARERGAVFGELRRTFHEEQKELEGLLRALQDALTTGAQASDSVRATLLSFDALLTRLQPSGADESANERPFDITEYTKAAAEAGAAAQRIESLLRQAQNSGAEIEVLSATAARELEAATDHAFRRALQLVLITIAAALVAGLLFRFAARTRFATGA